MDKNNHTITGNLKVVKLHCDDFLVSKNRRVRIWTPLSYDPNNKKPYRVIYMFDGQNLFDDATSFIGEWHVDESISEKEEEGIRPSIVVGLDFSADRLSEYLPSFSNVAVRELAYKGNITMKFLMNTVVPYVESHYNVSTKRIDNSIGGSSMGGLMSLAVGMQCQNKFSKIYAFSCAFPVFSFGPEEYEGEHEGLDNDDAFEYVLKAYSSKKMLNKFEIVMTSGGTGYEEYYFDYVKRFQKALMKAGWDKSNILTLQDKKLEHNEYQWSLFFPKAYEFFNK